MLVGSSGKQAGSDFAILTIPDLHRGVGASLADRGMAEVFAEDGVIA